MVLINNRELLAPLVLQAETVLYWRGERAFWGNLSYTDNWRAGEAADVLQEMLDNLFSSPQGIDVDAIALFGLIKSAKEHHFQLTDATIAACCCRFLPT